MTRLKEHKPLNPAIWYLLHHRRTIDELKDLLFRHNALAHSVLVVKDHSEYSSLDDFHDIPGLQEMDLDVYDSVKNRETRFIIFSLRELDEALMTGYLETYKRCIKGHCAVIAHTSSMVVVDGLKRMLKGKHSPLIEIVMRKHRANVLLELEDPIASLKLKVLSFVGLRHLSVRTTCEFGSSVVLPSLIELSLEVGERCFKRNGKCLPTKFNFNVPNIKSVYLGFSGVKVPELWINEGLKGSNSRIQLYNTNWSLEEPHGVIEEMCDHYSSICPDLAHCSFLQQEHHPENQLSGFGYVNLVGVPETFSTKHRLLIQHALSLLWKRQCPFSDTSSLIDRTKYLESESLQILRIFSVVEDVENSTNPLPRWVVPNLKLLALVSVGQGGSMWNLDSTFRMGSLQSLTLVGSDHECLELTSAHLSSVAPSLLFLTVSGYKLSFIEGAGQSVFPKLAHLAIDVSACDLIKGETTSLCVTLESREFPVLEEVAFLGTYDTLPHKHEHEIEVFKADLPISVNKVLLSTALADRQVVVFGVASPWANMEYWGVAEKDGFVVIRRDDVGQSMMCFLRRSLAAWVEEMYDGLWFLE